jgi:ABC-type uncharacterized transport system permease subunit
VGVLVGAFVGLLVGAFVGLLVGLFVGLLVGLFVGLGVGARVGFLVGKLVGKGVGQVHFFTHGLQTFIPKIFEHFEPASTQIPFPRTSMQASLSKGMGSVSMRAQNVQRSWE